MTTSRFARALALCATGALAGCGSGRAEWDVIHRTEAGEISVDPGRLQSLGNHRYRAWLRDRTREPGEEGSGAAGTVFVMQAEFDCGARAARFLLPPVPEGRVDEIERTDARMRREPAWQPLAAGTRMGGALTALCAYAGDEGG